MEKIGKLETQSADGELEEENAETLAAIDEGLTDASAGRSVSSTEVSKRLPEWITGSGTRKEH